MHEIKFIRNPLSSKDENDWQNTAHEWLLTLNGVSFRYYTGIGHRTPKMPYTAPLAEILRRSKPVTPKLEDILESLRLDASARLMSFQDWCDEFGYDQDSIKALNLYTQCSNTWDLLKRAGVDPRIVNTEEG